MIAPLPLFTLQEWGTVNGTTWIRHHYDVRKPKTIGGVDVTNAPLFASVQHYFRRPEPGEQNSYHLADFMIDIDFEEDFQKAIDTADVVTDYLDDAGAYYELYFSGSKGFHIEVPWQVIGATPSTFLHHNTYRTMAWSLQKDLAVTLCMSIYTRKRMFRVHNTPHQKTGLYKTRLFKDDLKGDAKDIRQMAKAPQVWAHPSNASGWVTRIIQAPALHNLYQQALLYKPDEKPPLQNKTVYPLVTHPYCIEVALREGPVTHGIRHKMSMNMAAYWASTAGDPRELIEWAEQVPGASRSPEHERVKDMSNVLRWASQTRPAFSCGIMQDMGLCDTSCPFYNPGNPRLG